MFSSPMSKHCRISKISSLLLELLIEPHNEILRYFLEQSNFFGILERWIENGIFNYRKVSHTRALKSNSMSFGSALKLKLPGLRTCPSLWDFTVLTKVISKVILKRWVLVDILDNYLCE